ncbi:hypothetical protein SAMN06265795_11417 [Noviherbaspirillum humi]|uniref:Uncharacterized protein n=1 Tax=Noviherbaspirillum humi TaxID=1688639 RepID=A0A239JXW6_9BURK|nr:hypothetical protein [Noviherbaspirillum humi]SNT10342.1 hypothetical protein SAMN06265795_11417 [Noviherbaspirillum humi]
MSTVTVNTSELVNGQAVSLADGSVNVNALSNGFCAITETGGKADQLWIASSKERVLAEAIDTDGNGDYDTIACSWGDPHFMSFKDVKGITNAEALRQYLDTAGYKATWDVQTNYTLDSSVSSVNMKVKETSPGSAVVVNDQASITFQRTNGTAATFSIDYMENGTLTVSDGMKVTRAAIQKEAPLTELKWNPSVSGDLFVADKNGVWNHMSQGTAIDHTGAVTKGSLTTPRENWTYKEQMEGKLLVNNLNMQGIGDGAAKGFNLSSLYLKSMMVDNDEEDKDGEVNQAVPTSGAFTGSIVAATIDPVNAAMASASNKKA